MTFTDSKEFKLTNQEETMVKEFARRYAEMIEKAGVDIMPSMFAVENLVSEIVNQLGNGTWFFGRALNEVRSGLSKVREGFEKTLPDRSIFKFKKEDLKQSLYDMGKYYFAKTFDHRYESLRSTSKSWIDLDDYVQQRTEQLKLDNMIEKLPELEGIFK